MAPASATTTTAPSPIIRAVLTFFETLGNGTSATDTFTYTVTDNHGVCAIATGTVVVSITDSGPVRAPPATPMRTPPPSSPPPPPSTAATAAIPSTWPPACAGSSPPPMAPASATTTTAPSPIIRAVLRLRDARATALRPPTPSPIRSPTITASPPSPPAPWSSASPTAARCRVRSGDTDEDASTSSPPSPRRGGDSGDSVNLATGYVLLVNLRRWRQRQPTTKRHLHL